MTKTGKAKLVKPDNTLKEKVGSGGFDQAVLAKAQTMLEKNDVDFRPIATDLLKELNDTLISSKESQESPAAILGAVMYPLMQLKAQGTLFHYPSITYITGPLIDFLEITPELNAEVREILEGYKKSIQAIIALQLKDDHSKAVKDLSAALIDACARYEKFKSKQA